MHDAARDIGMAEGLGEFSAPEIPVATYTPAQTLQLSLKRLLDLFGALVGGLAITPLLAVIAIAIKLDSPGPVLFRQRRIGRGGRPFTFYKFRTMQQDNDPGIHKDYVSALIREDVDDLKGENGSYKIESDPRVTRVGRVLRRTSLDELPQLLNVVVGQMSLVGPRPPIDYEVELYEAREWGRLAVVPGMTGLWQVSGRAETTYQEMVDLDLEYIRTWSLLLDLEILIRTVGAVFDRKGAW
jgi:lipopolysaccharide/colanic/teichoic acid biosynthesis glycosyltransferase